MKIQWMTAALVGFFIAVMPAFSNASKEQASTVALVAEQVEPIRLETDCKIVRTQEPKGILTYKVMQWDGLKTLTRPMYSDLCDYPTQQFITKIYYYLSNNEQMPVVGMVGGNEDIPQLSFVTFSGHVLPAK